MDKPKLLIIWNMFGSFSESEKDGVLPRVLDLFDIYSKNFEKVYVITIDGKKFKDLPKNVEHIPFPNVPLKKYFYLLFAGIVGYRHVDYVEAFGNATSVAPIFVYKILGKKVFLYHRWDLAAIFKDNGRYTLAFLAEILQILGFKVADTIAVTTNRLGDEARKYAKKSKVFLLPNHVDTNLFKRTETKKIHNSLIFVGRLHPDKNLHMLLDVMKGLPQFKLWIIGRGRLEDELINIKKKNKTENVEFLGAKSHEELPKYLNKAEAFILVSHREGHPKALIEAMACELPCMGTNVAGINDVIINGKTGLLCEKNIESIRSCILELFKDKKRKLELGKNARKFVIKNYSKDKITKKRMSLIIKGMLENK